jgi:hypothetical protein
MKFIFLFIIFSSNVLALAVTPSSIDFTGYDKAKIVVFNTEDFVKDFSVDVYGSGFDVDKSSLRIPPRSKSSVNLSSSCRDCEAKLYIRELSNSKGIKIESAVVIALKSGEPEGSDNEFDIYQQNKVTSFSFIDVKKPEVLVFIIILSLLLVSSAVFLGRKLYINKFFSKNKAKAKKWLKKLF